MTDRTHLSRRFLFRVTGTRMVDRGFTLLELLIVLAILLAIMALVYPTLDRGFRKTVFRETINQVQSLTATARFRAQHDGRMVQVLWQPVKRQIVLSHFEDTTDESEFDLNNEELILDSTIEEQSVFHVTGWDKVVLPEGFVLQTSQESRDDSDNISDNATYGVDIEHSADQMQGESGVFERFGTEEDELQSIPLAVFLPDGSSLISSSFTITDRSGRSATLTLNQWTGILSVQIIEDTSLAIGLDDEEVEINVEEERYAEDLDGVGGDQ